MKNLDFGEALESYSIIDDPDVIAVESFIYSALESDNSSVRNLKSDLNKLVKAKASGNETAVKQAKEDVKDSIEDVKNEAEQEKNSTRKAKLKKFAKIGGIIAGTIAAAATVAVVAKKIKDNKLNSPKQISSDIGKKADEIKTKVSERQAESNDTRERVQKSRAELLKKIDRAAAEIEADNNRVRSEMMTPEEKEKIRRQMADVEKKMDAARAHDQLVRKIGRITDGDKNVELTEDEAKAVRELAKNINSGIDNLMAARLGSNYGNIKNITVN